MALSKSPAGVRPPWGHGLVHSAAAPTTTNQNWAGGPGSQGTRLTGERAEGRAEREAGSGSLCWAGSLRHRPGPDSLAALDVGGAFSEWKMEAEHLVEHSLSTHTWASPGLGLSSQRMGRTETLGDCSARGKHRVLGVPGQALRIKWASRILPGGRKGLDKAWNG